MKPCITRFLFLTLNASLEFPDPFPLRDIEAINPYHAEFLKWNNPTSILELSIIIFRDIKIKTKLDSQQYRAWSDCTDVQAGLALYWSQRLFTFGVGRIRVKCLQIFIIFGGIFILIIQKYFNILKETKIEFCIHYII